MIEIQYVRSPLFYVGDKFKLVPQIISLFPKNIDNFYEPFTGGGSVPLNVKARTYHLNDIDKNIVDIHKLLISFKNHEEKFFREVTELAQEYGLSRSFEADIVPDDLKKEWKKTYFARFNKDPYIKLRQDYNAQNPRSTLYLYLLLIYGFNRMIRFNTGGNFNVPVGNVDFNANVETALKAYFAWARTSQIMWTQLDCNEFLKSHKFSENDFVYLDPPYLITFSEYNKIWNDKKELQLLELLDTLNERGARFAISNVTHYKGRVNDIFVGWSAKYKSHKVKSNYISYHDNSIKSFKEVLVTNYAPPTNI